MPTPFSNLTRSAVAAFATAALTACVSPTPPVSTHLTPAAEPQIVSLSAGQRLSFIFIDIKDGADAAAVRQTYTRSVFPLARTYGLETLSQFSVVGIGGGSFEPQRVGLFAWPSASVEAEFNKEQTWKQAKATRPSGWDHLRVVSVDIAKDVTLKLDPSKTYTLASAWLTPERPDDYAAYLTGIDPAVNASGGRFVKSFMSSEYESHSAPYDGPDQLTLVEWNSPDGLSEFLKTDGFKQHQSLLGTGTQRFEVLVLSLE